MSRTSRTSAVLLAVALSFVACTERRLVGAWESVATPKQTLDLQADRTFSLRFSGKTLSFLSDLAGPQRGTWAVKSDALVLTYPSGKSETWPVLHLTSDYVDLAGQRWTRVASAAAK